jgi:hypothetical protein
MNTNISDYKIICNRTSAFVEEEVKKALAEGWHLGQKLMVKRISDKSYVMVQVMVKYA